MATYSLEEITEQLADVRKVLDLARAYGTPDRASQLGMNSILQEEARLLGELKSLEMAQNKTAVEVAVDGDPVRDHAISISFFGQMLVILQNLTNAVAQVQANVQTARGNIPNNLISGNRFELATVFQSSFGVRLRLPEEEQRALFPNDTESAADVVCNLLDGQNIQQETIDFLSHSRVRGHYASLVDLIGKQGASVAFRTQKHPHGSKLSAQQARDRSTWLDLLKTVNDVIEVEGALVGGSIETIRFQIKNVSGEILQGAASDTAVAQMRSINWGAQVTARLEVATSTHEEAELEPRTTYRLLEILREE